MTTEELLRIQEPHPFWIISDRYGGTYSGGEFTCFWNVNYPDEVLSGDVECMEIWDQIKSRTWPEYGLQPRRGGVGVGAGRTVDDAIWAAAMDAGVQQERS